MDKPELESREDVREALLRIEELKKAHRSPLRAPVPGGIDVSSGPFRHGTNGGERVIRSNKPLGG